MRQFKHLLIGGAVVGSLLLAVSTAFASGYCPPHIYPIIETIADKAASDPDNSDYYRSNIEDLLDIADCRDQLPWKRIEAAINTAVLVHADRQAAKNEKRIDDQFALILGDDVAKQVQEEASGLRWDIDVNAADIVDNAERIKDNEGDIENHEIRILSLEGRSGSSGSDIGDLTSLIGQGVFNSAADVKDLTAAIRALHTAIKKLAPLPASVAAANETTKAWAAVASESRAWIASRGSTTQTTGGNDDDDDEEETIAVPVVAKLEQSLFEDEWRDLTNVSTKGIFYTQLNASVKLYLAPGETHTGLSCPIKVHLDRKTPALPSPKC